MYYHYWFGHGTKILERQLQEVINSRKPDFPFCILGK
ncbi:MAG: glycoside hydrolase family 99-like domain-containing protein [Bacteroidetes bacterium]|nr:glycoside hydrolase family 99-like domain-containing protein [Bacteroidota bacterium]